MQITSVHYSRLVNLGNYENHKVAAWATVEEGETPVEALEALKTWVEARVREESDAVDALNQIRQDIHAKRHELRGYEERLAEGKKRFERAREFLTGLGIALPEGFRDDDLPF